MSAYDADLSAGVPASAIAADFLSSSEFQAVHGTQTNSQFVGTLFQGFLGRQPDAAGGAFYTGLLASGTSRAAIAVGIANSAEAKAYLAPTDEPSLGAERRRDPGP